MTVETLHTASEVHDMVSRLGAAIAADHPDGVVLTGVLNASVVFMADLVRAMADIPLEVDFIATSSFRPDSGRMRLLKDLDLDISGRHVLLVTNLIDTGLRLGYLRGRLLDRSPESVRLCALFDKIERRILPIDIDYVGTTVPNRFLVGYGLDHHQRYRNLTAVYTADLDDPADQETLAALLVTAAHND